MKRREERIIRIIEYFRSEDRAHWLEEIGKSDWRAGQYLHDLLEADGLQALAGEGVRVLLLAEGDRLVSFCTLAERDDVQPTELTPWIGFVYTFPAYRGRRCIERLIRHAEQLAAEAGAWQVYISTDHVGLYERYGYTFHAAMKDMHGGDTRVYTRRIAAAE